MLGKMKQWFGIEGVKVELILPEEIEADLQQIDGQLAFRSMSPQHISSIHLKLVEKYARGRKEERLIDEYTLGKVSINQGFDVPAEQEVLINFSLPYTIVKSEMDEMGDSNIFLKGLSSLAKTIQKVKSEYRVEVEAKVEGTRLHPFDKKIIKLK